MSIVDKIVAAITPPESDETRAEARAKARASATPGDWLSMILDHHEQLEAAFAAAKSAAGSDPQRAAEKRLGTILTGHAIAEEAVVYPGMAQAGEKVHAGMGYTEQATVKMQMAQLEQLQPGTEDYRDKLEHIEGAVLHHMYQEEGTWFLELKEKVPAADQVKITQRYKEEFDRYMGADAR